MRIAPESAWTPLGVAARRVVEGVVVRNPRFAKTWIKHDLTAVHTLARLGISPSGERL